MIATFSIMPVGYPEPLFPVPWRLGCPADGTIDYSPSSALFPPILPAHSCCLSPTTHHTTLPTPHHYAIPNAHHPSLTTALHAAHQAGCSAGRLGWPPWTRRTRTGAHHTTPYHTVEPDRGDGNQKGKAGMPRGSEYTADSRFFYSLLYFLFFSQQLNSINELCNHFRHI